MTDEQLDKALKIRARIKELRDFLSEFSNPKDSGVNHERVFRKEVPISLGSGNSWRHVPIPAEAREKILNGIYSQIEEELAQIEKEYENI